jgi:ribosomal protein L16 Arg81 hydroxylase
MDRQRLTFRDLIAPIGAGQFFEQYYRKQPLHVPGGDDRFAEVFSWRELNHLLSMTNIWSDLSLELSLDGRNLPAEDYCYSGLDRDNKKSDNPDFRRVFEHLRQGASLTLNFIERLTPALRAQSQTFAAVLCVPVNCSVFCSWQKTQGYASHFDTPQVFVCHIAGVKRWRIYEGRMATAAPIEGARSSNFPPEHHERAKGRVMQEVVMTPGDLLYVPHGQYHDAVAESGESLHLSFVVRHLVAQDFVTMLSHDLPKDPLFRQHLPHLDAAAGAQDYRRRIAERIQQIMVNPQIGEGLQQFLHGKAFERFFEFGLPSRESPAQYRVRWLGVRLEQRGDVRKLHGANGVAELDETEGAIADWAIRKDYFSPEWLIEDLPEIDRDRLAPALDKLQRLGLVAPI